MMANEIESIVLDALFSKNSAAIPFNKKKDNIIINVFILKRFSVR